MDRREMARRWAQAWKKAGPELEAIRRKEVAEADNLEVLASLEGAFNHASGMPPRESSGLVQMQRCLAKLAR